MLGRELTILAYCSHLIKFSFVEAGSLPLALAGSTSVQLLLSDNMKLGATAANSRCCITAEELGGGKGGKGREAVCVHARGPRPDRYRTFGFISIDSAAQSSGNSTSFSPLGQDDHVQWRTQPLISAPQPVGQDPLGES